MADRVCIVYVKGSGRPLHGLAGVTAAQKYREEGVSGRNAEVAPRAYTHTHTHIEDPYFMCGNTVHVAKNRLHVCVPGGRRHDNRSSVYAIGDAATPTYTADTVGGGCREVH